MNIDQIKEMLSENRNYRDQHLIWYHLSHYNSQSTAPERSDLWVINLGISHHNYAPTHNAINISAFFLIIQIPFNNH